MSPDTNDGTAVERARAALPGPARKGFAVPSPAPEPPHTDYTRPLRELVRAIGRNRARLVAAVVAGVLLGFGAGFVRKPRYEARTTLEMEGLNENFLNIRDVNPTSIAGLYTPEAYLQTQTRILQSDSLLREVARQLNLGSTEEFSLHRGRLKTWLYDRLPAVFPPITPEEHTIEQMRLALSVESSKETRIVEIAVKCKDAKLAASIANQLAQDYIDSLLDTRWDMYQRTADRLTRQLSDLRKQVEVAGAALRDYSRTSGLLFTEAKDRDTLPEENLRELQGDLTKAQTDRIATQAQYEVMSNAADGTLGDLAGNTALQQYEKDLASLRRQLASALVAMKPEHPAVKRLQSEVAVLEATVARERAAFLARTRQLYESAQRRENMLSDAYRSYAKRVSDQSEKITQYKLLRHELETTQQVHDSMFQKVKEAGLAAALRTTNVRVVDPATPPSRPYWPNHILNTSLGFAGGLFIALFWIFGREYGSERLRYPGQLWTNLGVPEIGCVPTAKTLARKGARRGSLSLASQPGQLLLDAPPLLRDSIRTLGPSVLFAADQISDHAILVLTSLGANEGKTTLAAGISASITACGRRVLLIDGDLRKPGLHELLDVPLSPGFADALEQSADLSVPIDKCVRATTIPGLSVMTAGAVRHATPTRLYSPQLGSLLERCSKEFDMVVVDGPPLTTPESRALCRAGSGALLVVKAGAWDLSDVRTAMSLAAGDGVPIAGAILNRFDGDMGPNWYPYRAVQSTGTSL